MCGDYYDFTHFLAHNKIGTPETSYLLKVVCQT